MTTVSGGLLHHFFVALFDGGAYLRIDVLPVFENTGENRLGDATEGTHNVGDEAFTLRVIHNLADEDMGLGPVVVIVVADGDTAVEVGAVGLPATEVSGDFSGCAVGPLPLFGTKGGSECWLISLAWI